MKPLPETARTHRDSDVLRQRRRKLTALEEAFDTGVAHDRQRALCALLRQPLITAEHQPYRLVRTHGEWLRTWFAHHADWQLSITSEAARLRKTPATLEDASRPCRDPKSNTALTRRGYIYLSLLIAVLVRSDRQTTLGTLAEQLGGHLRADPVFEERGIHAALETPGDRRELVGAIRVLQSWGALTRVQGNEESFMHDREADVLYSVNRPILARLLAATNAPSLSSESSFEGRLASTCESPLGESEEGRHRRWRTHLFRRLLDDPVLYYDTLSEDERAYFDRQRASILSEIEKATGLVREVRAEGIAMVDPRGTLTDYKLPEDGTEGHLTLLLAEHLAETLRQRPDSNRDGRVAVANLIDFTAKQIEKHQSHWRKAVRERGQDRVLTGLVLTRLEALSLIRRDNEENVIPLPALGRYALAKGPESTLGSGAHEGGNDLELGFDELL